MPDTRLLQMRFILVIGLSHAYNVSDKSSNTSVSLVEYVKDVAAFRIYLMLAWIWVIFVGNIKKFEFDEQQNAGSVNIFPPKKKMKIFKAPMASEFTEVPNLPPLKFSFVLPDGYPTVGFENFCNF